jgi:hypothetical protein
MDVLCISSSKGPLYIVGRGCTLPLHQGSQEAAAKGRSNRARTAAARVGPVGPPETLSLAGRPPRNPNHGRPNGLLLVNWPIR